MLSRDRARSASGQPVSRDVSSQRALTLELGLRGVPCLSEAPVAVRYKGEDLGCGYRADIVFWPDADPVLLELKALKRRIGIAIA
jgi:hypothetical protein